MNNTRIVLIISILAMIVSLLGSIVENVASSVLPESWSPYLWVAWPIFGLFLVISIVLVIWQAKASQVLKTLPPKPAYIHEGWFLKHNYLTLPYFTGRKMELDYLSNWLQYSNDRPLLVLHALGGFGKSALVWHWLHNESAPKSLEKVVWWGFYDDNSFDTFLRETLEYLDINPKALSSYDQVEMLARYVHQNKILIVMDGFERALRAYSNMKAAYQGDEEKWREITNNQCVSIHAGRFLQRIASLNARGRVLLTTRLLPDDIKAKLSGDLIAGCLVHGLDKMLKEDATEFFRKQNVKGTRAEIETACEVYGFHPLSLRLLVGRITKERSRDINLARNFKIDADLKGRQNHILKVAYDKLSRNHRLLISQIAALRSPMTFDAIKVFDEKPSWWTRLFFGRQDIKTALNDFVERGLIQHDPNKDQYDLHPIVRRYAYEHLTTSDRIAAHARLSDYFSAVDTPAKPQTISDLAPVIEFYFHTAQAGQYDKAQKILQKRLTPHPLYFQFGAYQLIAELLESFFIDGEDKLPCLEEETAQTWALNELALVYAMSGQPRRAVPLLELSIKLDEKLNEKSDLAIDLGNLAQIAQLPIGELRAADSNLRRYINLSKELGLELENPDAYYELGRLLAYCGLWEESEKNLKIAEELADKKGANQTSLVSVARANHALHALLMARDPIQSSTQSRKSAIEFAKHALGLAQETSKTYSHHERDFIRAHWLLGAAYRLDMDLDLAEHHLIAALSRDRAINLVEVEADILLDLARLRYDQKKYEEAKSLTQEALTITERCSFVLQGADVNLFLAQYTLEQDKNKSKAREYAETALKLAHCNGPPYYYRVAYEEAERILKQLVKS